MLALAGCILAGSTLFVHRTAQQASAYSIQDLGTLGGKTSIAYAINNNSDVVGQAENDLGANHAFLWSQGKMRDLGGFPDPFTKESNSNMESTADSINDQDEIVGDADMGYGSVNGDPRGVYHAAIWHNGTLNDLGTLSGYGDSTATKIGGSGLVLGRAIQQEDGPRTHSYKDRTFFCKNGKMWLFSDSFNGLDVNAQGQIAGWQRRGGRTYVVILDHQRVRNLGAIAPGYIVEDLVINNSGQVAMTLSGCNNENDSLNYRLLPAQAVIWKGNRWQKLAGLPSQPETTISGLSSSGQAVGQARTLLNDATASHQDATAVLWQTGKIKDLNQAIPQSLGWKLKSATGINDRGQIVGFGTVSGQDHAFLLTPIRR